MAQGPFLRDESRMRDAGSQDSLSLRKQGILVKYAQKYIFFQSQKGRILVFLFKDIEIPFVFMKKVDQFHTMI
jgi:hypothetical protein